MNINNYICLSNFNNHYMETPKKVGAKPKYRENVKTTTLHILIPLEKKDDCIKAINGIVYPFKY